MMRLEPLDPAFPVQQQMSQEVGPVVLINLFTLDPADEAAFRDAWATDAAHMKARPGYISAQLHRAVGPIPTYLNYARWESVETFSAAFSDPGFRASLEAYPSSVVASPHLFTPVAVPGICLA